MDVAETLNKYYNLNPLKLSQMEGYGSTNFKVEIEECRYVLKKHQATEENAAILEEEHRVMRQLQKLENYDFPLPIALNNGDFLLIQNGGITRLLSYIGGDFLANVPHTPLLLMSFGKFLAKMDKNLLDGYFPAVRAKAILWDLKHFQSNYPLIKYIPEASDRNLVDYFFLQFEQQLIPVENKLRKSTIHNDANDWNVLTKGGEISGIIDFGDMVYSWLINELAVALTYIMMDKENPLEAAAYVIEDYHKVLPLEILELDILYYLIAARLCTSVCGSAYAKTKNPASTYITISEKPAWQLLRKWLAINPIAAKNTFRKASGYPPSEVPLLKKQLKRRSLNFSKTLSLSYDRPIQMHRAAFQYMYDVDGNSILDAYNNIMLAGHAHPKVVRAGQKAMARLNTNTRYLYDQLLSYSDKLLSKFPPTLSKVFFVNSGSAASDLAIRLALAHTQKEKIMVLEEGYHGNTRTGISISNYKYKKEGLGGKKNHIIEAPLPKVFGSGLKDDGSAGSYFAKMASTLISKDQNQIAAFIAEPIAGCAGQVPLAMGYLKKVYAEVRKQGGVCISDEVQVGFGRLGRYFWGYEMHDVVPDIVVVGKPMGNGHPIGAVITTKQIAESFEEGPEFFSSFGGNPVSCAIGEAVLNVIEEEGLQKVAQEIGDFLKEGLENLKSRFSELADVRGVGLFLGVELLDKKGQPNTRLAKHVKNELRERNILISTDGPFDNVLKIKPPLCFSKEDATKLLKIIGLVLKDSE